MLDVHKICDYVILMCTSAGEQLNLLKLQKLLYYVQAWHLAFFKLPLFRGRFQAWIHGPVSREIYDRFSATKSLYSSVGSEDMQAGFDPEGLDAEVKLHINNVLEVYAPLSDSQLEDQTHSEEPWIRARQGFLPTQRCEVEIEEPLMGDYYARRLDKKAN